MPSSSAQPRAKWFAVGTNLSASVTPPADAAIAEDAVASDTVGIRMPPEGQHSHVGEQILIRAVLKTSGGAPSMKICVYGFIREYISQGLKTAAQAGAGTAGEGRWVHLGWLNEGNAVTAAAHPWCIPASGVLDWVEAWTMTGAAFERLHIQVWESAGTGAVVDTYVGLTGVV